MKSSCHFLRILSGLVLALLLIPAPGMAGPDDFLGDSIIYTAGGSGDPPNILFIIDRSTATRNKAAGVPYDPDPTKTAQYTGGRNPWDIYVSDNKGVFTNITTSNSTVALESLNCSAYPSAQIKETLLDYGTYSGSGTAASPIIKTTGGGSQCQTATNGGTYALGNYLNYLDTPPPNPKVVGTDGKDYYLLAEHNSGTIPQPGGDDDSLWKDYWALAGTVNEGQTWLPNHEYDASARTQREIMFSALQAVIRTKFHVANFGLATYGSNKKGANIFEDVQELSITDVTAESGVPPFFKKIPGSGDPLSADNQPTGTSPSGPQRSQAEALYDAGYYLAEGLAGSSDPYTPISTTDKIPTAIRNLCDNTHVIFITNGLSNGDNDPNLSGVTLNADGSHNYSDPAVYPDSEIQRLGADTTTEGSYGEGTHHLDDVAWYLRKNHQITTHIVLAFQAWDQLLARTAMNGEGKFANVYDEAGMIKAIEGMINPILQEVDTAFVAPVVPANPENRTFSGSRLYLGFFYPKQDQPWYGNLKKFGINDHGAVVDRHNKPATCPDYDEAGALLSVCAGLAPGAFKPTATSYWNPCPEGDASCGDGSSVDAGGVGAVLHGSDITQRKIYTYLGDSTPAHRTLTNSVNRFSKRAEVRVAMGATGTDSEKDEVIDFVHGQDVWDFDEDLNAAEKRNWILGDILHSKPLVVGYNHFEYAEEGVCPGNADAWSNGTGGTSSGINKTVIYVGSNDGMLHAFRDCDGAELWSFIPPDLLPKLPLLNTGKHPGHQYFVDGTPTVYFLDQNRDKIIGADDKVILLFGLRRGGGKDTLDETASRGAYYALDVTDPAAPVFLGKIDNSTVPSGTSLPVELGETWSQPTIARIKEGGTTKIVFFVGAGYDNNEDLRFGNTQTFPAGTEATTATTDTTAGTNDAYMDDSGQPRTSSGDGVPFNPRGRGIYCFEVARATMSGWNYDNFGTLIRGITVANNSDLTFSIPSDLTILDMNYDGFADRIYAGDTGGQIWRFDVGNTVPAAWTSRLLFQANPDSGQKGRKIFYRPSVVVKHDYVSLVFGTGDREHPLNFAVADRLYMVKDTGGTTPLTEANLLDVTNFPQGLTAADSATLEGSAGWYITLPLEGEKVLAPALVFSGIAYFTTYTPSTEADVITSCTEGNLGTARLWAVSFRDGTAVFFPPPGSSDPADEKVRVINIGEGIPSGLVPTINEDGSSGGFIGCGAGLCKSPDTNNRLVYPLYWKQW
jgi:type IV pilus assembly protein PilY1